MKIIKNIFIAVFLCSLTSCSEETIDAFGTGTITGTVVEDGNNEPLENVKISSNPATSTVFTDENGNFTLNNVPEGDYSIQAMKDGLLTQFEGATVLPNSEVNVIFEMQPENANNRQPSAPQAIAPEDNAEGITVAVNFTWNSIDPEGDELFYELEIRNEEDDEVLLYFNITDTTYTVEGLEYDHKYFWQVTVSDSVNEPVLSPLYSFETLDFPISSRYLYVKRINGNNVIFASDADGNEFQLTSSNQNSFRPRKNNSNNKIAFLRTLGAQTHLFTMNLDGSQQQQVTSSIPVNGFNLNQIDFSWANDGLSLVYPNFEKLYSVNATGGGTQLIYETPNGKFITEVDMSEDNSRMALLVNNANGYEASIYTVDMSGNILTSILSEVPGAVGGIDISVDNKQVLYSYDVSGFESPDYRQLDSRLFIYNLSTNEIWDISENKPEGTNDLDPRFSPNEAEVIFVNTSNDGISPKNIFKLNISGNNDEDNNNRTKLFQDAFMPDWE